MMYFYPNGRVYASGSQSADGILRSPIEGCFLKNHPLCSVTIRGLWRQRFIFCVRGGKQYMRQGSAYDLCPKASLIPYQASFAAAVAAWQSLSASTKESLNARSSKLGLNYAGYHYFIHLWLKSSPEVARYWP